MSYKNDPQFIELKKEFESSLRDRVQVLQEIKKDVDDGLDLKTCAQNYLYVVHKLAGIARSFDFIQVADYCEKDDERWAEILESGQTFTHKDLGDSIQKALQSLSV